MTTPKTSRLTELEAGEYTPKDERGYLDGVTLGIRRATIDGYRMAQDDYQELADFAQGILNEIPPCNCDEGFSERGLDDPSCVYHNFVTTDVEGLRDALSKLFPEDKA